MRNQQQQQQQQQQHSRWWQDRTQNHLCLAATVNNNCSELVPAVSAWAQPSMLVLL
jgi:hypothetical protein